MTDPSPVLAGRARVQAAAMCSIWACSGVSPRLQQGTISMHAFPQCARCSARHAGAGWLGEMLYAHSEATSCSAACAAAKECMCRAANAKGLCVPADTIDLPAQNVYEVVLTFEYPTQCSIVPFFKRKLASLKLQNRGATPMGAPIHDRACTRQHELVFWSSPSAVTRPSITQMLALFNQAGLSGCQCHQSRDVCHPWVHPVAAMLRTRRL